MAWKDTETPLAPRYVAEVRRMITQQRWRIARLKENGNPSEDAEQTLGVLLRKHELFARKDHSAFSRSQKLQELLDSAVIKVADGRGFVVEGTEARYVVAPASQLPFSPTHRGYRSEANKQYEPLGRPFLRVIRVMPFPRSDRGHCDSRYSWWRVRGTARGGRLQGTYASS
jgi:hypothetical protein